LAARQDRGGQFIDAPGEVFRIVGLEILRMLKTPVRTPVPKPPLHAGSESPHADPRPSHHLEPAPTRTPKLRCNSRRGGRITFSDGDQFIVDLLSLKADGAVGPCVPATRAVLAYARSKATATWQAGWVPSASLRDEAGERS